MRYKFSMLINNMKIKNKLILTYLIVAITTVSVVGIYLTNKMTNIVINKSITEAESNAKSMQNRVEEVIRIATRVSDLIYSDEKLCSMVSKEYNTYAEVVDAYSNYSELRKYVKYYNEFSSITLYIDNKTLLENSEITRASDSIKEEEWYKDAVNNGGKISWVYKKDEITNMYYLSLVRAMKDSNGKIMGVITINISPSTLKTISKSNEQENIIAVDYQTVSLNKNYIINKEKIEEEIVRQSEDNKNMLIKTKYNDQKSYIVENKFNVEKSQYNEFEILIILPITSITNETNKVIFNSLIVIIATIILSLLLIRIFTKTISTRISLLSEEMNRVVKGDFKIKNVIQGNDEIAELYKDLIKMIESIKKLINDVYIEKIQKEKLKANQKEMEFKMLSSQINPHFLYNTLETIRMKCICCGQKDIAAIVKKLGMILRKNLEMSGKIVTLKSELELIKNYLEIQSIRFDGKVTYDINIGDNIDVDNYKILPLLLQPIVENAYIHGIEDKEDKGNILINIFIEESKMIIEVNDNGVGMTEEKLMEINKLLVSNNTMQTTHIGIKNVNQRIKLYYGNNYGISFRSEKNKGTSVLMSLPI